MKSVMFTLVVLVAVLLAGSCCTRTDSQGVTTKSFLNCSQAAQEMVCNPTDSVKAIVQIATPIIAGIVNVAIPGSTAYFDAQRALNVLNSIQKVGCTSLTALNELIAFIKSDVFKTAAAKYQAKLRASPAEVNVEPLIDWSHTAK